MLWKASEGWVWNAIAYLPNPDTAFRYEYHGPCLTPAQHSAAVEAARVESWIAAREAAACVVDAEIGKYRPLSKESIAASIRALTPPDSKP